MNILVRLVFLLTVILNTVPLSDKYLCELRNNNNFDNNNTLVFREMARTCNFVLQHVCMCMHISVFFIFSWIEVIHKNY